MLHFQLSSKPEIRKMEYPRTTATRHSLPNGLTLILDPDPSAPVISVQAWIATGSIHEEKLLGAGLSHFLEHMVFKGTRDLDADTLAKSVQAAGGHWNAYTTFDRTVYYIDGPSHSLETFLHCLTGLVFFPLIPASEFENEKEVIRREIDMGLDNPDNASTQLLLTTAFTVDSRRQPVIGHRHLFDAISHQNLLDYHRSRYTTDRTHIVISGDFDPDQARETVIALTADAKLGGGPEPYLAADHPQIGPRRGRETFAIPTSRICLSWKTPAIHHPDAPAYDILAAILGRGRSSRLHRALREEQELALEISAWSWIGAGQEGLFAISAETLPAKRETLIAAISQEIQKFPSTALDDDLAKAKRQIAASQFRTLTSASGRASDLASNWHEARDLDFTRHYLATIQAVTAADLRRIAAKLTPETHSLTILDPIDTQDILTEKKSKAATEILETHTLSNGLKLALLPDHRVPLIHFQAAARAGLPSETPEKNGLNQLLASSITKGTTSRKADEIALALESLGASISAATGNNALLVQAAGLATDTTAILDIFADVILNPTFPSDSVSREKASQLAALEEALADPLHCGFAKLRETHFSSTGYGLDPLGSLQSLPSLQRIDLVAHHARHFNAHNMTLCVTGDFHPCELITMLENHFAKLPPGTAWTPPPSATHAGKTANHHLPKKQAILTIAYPGSAIHGPDRHSLAFIQEYASDMAGPLFGRIREELGLAYRVGATQFLGYDTGLFTFYVATSPEQLDLAKNELLLEIEKIATSAIPDPETFERVRSTVLSGHALQQQSPSSNARHIALDILFGNPADTHLKLPTIYAKITPETVLQAARRTFSQPPTIAIITPPDQPVAGT